MVFGYQGMPEVGDKVHIYYRADEAFHVAADLKKNLAGHLSLATLRNDGFVSLDAGKRATSSRSRSSARAGSCTSMRACDPAVS